MTETGRLPRAPRLQNLREAARARGEPVLVAPYDHIEMRVLAELLETEGIVERLKRQIIGGKP